MDQPHYWAEGSGGRQDNYKRKRSDDQANQPGYQQQTFQPQWNQQQQYTAPLNQTYMFYPQQNTTPQYYQGNYGPNFQNHVTPSQQSFQQQQPQQGNWCSNPNQPTPDYNPVNTPQIPQYPQQLSTPHSNSCNSWGFAPNHSYQNEELGSEEDCNVEFNSPTPSKTNSWGSTMSSPVSSPVTPQAFQSDSFQQTPGTVPSTGSQLSPEGLTELLAKYHQKNLYFEAELQKTAQIIRGQQIPLTPDRANSLANGFSSLKADINTVLTEAVFVPHSSLLPCRQLHDLESYQHHFKRQLAQIDMYIVETQGLAEASPPVLAFLYIQSEPFPTAIKQFVIIPPIEVRLLTGAKTQLNIQEPVRADLYYPSSNVPRRAMEGCEEPLQNGVAKFEKLKFLVGSACKIEQLDPFYAEKRKVESTPSEAFVIMTNTKQWCEAQGIVLKKQLFGGQIATRSQQYFCNCLQNHYLQATRQTPLNAQRSSYLRASLLPKEFSFLMAKKHQNKKAIDVITPEGFDSFWAWFGTVMQKIRYQKFLLPMWTKGLFWGFISKEDSEDVLQRWEAGVFLLRFSETQVGAIAIAYKQSPSQVRHYLMKPSDFGQGRSLPQFIRETPSLLYFLQITSGEDFRMQLTTVEKNHALVKIGERRRKANEDEEQSCYDEEIRMLQQQMQQATLSDTPQRGDGRNGRGAKNGGSNPRKGEKD